MRRWCSPLLVAGFALSATSDAEAIVIRHDVDDAEYVVDPAEYPALTDLISPGDCIGTLVEASHVLSVAHCAVDLEAGDALTFAGVDYTVQEVFLHPQWDDEDAFDIAVVRLTEPVVGVEPMPVYRGEDEDGATLTLVGRGVTATGLVGEAGGRTDGLLRRATNVVISADEHFLEVVFEEPDDPSVLPLEGVGAAGDSGCPAFIEVDGVRYVAGLNSYGDADGNVGIAEYGSFDYQTRVSRYLDWLDMRIEPEPSGTGSTGSSGGGEDSTGPEPNTSTEGSTGTAASSGPEGTSSGDGPQTSSGTDTDAAAGQGDPDSGCGGCSTPDRGAASGWLLALLAGLLGRRRRALAGR